MKSLTIRKIQQNKRQNPKHTEQIRLFKYLLLLVSFGQFRIERLGDLVEV